jgi:Domain of Unknown Function (DUF928)
MTISCSALRCIFLSFSLGATLNFYLDTVPPVIAQSIEPPPGQGAPSGTVGGGSRTSTRFCVKASSPQAKKLKALIPQGQVGLTVSDRPHLWFYLPKTTAQTLELSLFDAQMNGLYQTTLSIDEWMGLVNLPWPQTAPKLHRNQLYYWTIALVCNPRDRTDDWVVGGWIKRIEVDQKLRAALAATDADPISLYIQRGLWHEALSILSEQRRNEPGNSTLATIWSKILQAIDLTAYLSAANATSNK